VRPVVQHVDGSRYCPYSVQGARGACSGAAMAHRARGVAQEEVIGGKILAGHVHGPRRNDAARWQPCKRTEDDVRCRSGSSPAQRWCGGDPAGKVGVQWLGEQLRALVVSCDLCTGREEECAELSIATAVKKIEAATASSPGQT
jgi:hypothetical protein